MKAVCVLLGTAGVSGTITFEETANGACHSIRGSLA